MTLLLKPAQDEFMLEKRDFSWASTQTRFLKKRKNLTCRYIFIYKILYIKIINLFFSSKDKNSFKKLW